jgi:hypothetical protein
MKWTTSAFVRPEQMLLETLKYIMFDKFPIHYLHNFVDVQNSPNKV